MRLELDRDNPARVVAITFDIEGKERWKDIADCSRAELVAAATLHRPNTGAQYTRTGNVELLRLLDGGVVPGAVPAPAPTPAAAPTPAPPRVATADALKSLVDSLGGLTAPEVENIIDDKLAPMTERISAEIEAALSSAPARRVEIQIRETVTELPDLHHRLLPELIQLLATGSHCMLVGPAGSGKSTLAEQAASALGLAYRSISLDPTIPTSRLFGFIDATGAYRGTPYREAYEEGGVMLLDELDNGHPGIVSALNQSLAGPSCAFADGMVSREPSWVVVATANTYGKGGDRQYVGRNALDAATLDRFLTVDVDYDIRLERSAALAYATDETNAQVETWITRVGDIRERVLSEALPLIVSPRATIEGAKLIAAGVNPARVLTLRVSGAWTAEQRARVGA